MGKITREKKLFLLFALLTFAWMCVIFAFSAADSTDSAELSGSLLVKLLSAVVPHWSAMSEAKHEQIVESLHTLFRKCGHFSEYTVLGILMTCTVRQFLKIKSRLTLPKAEIWLPVLLSFLYAVSDEVHQRFVPGRSCEFRDVMIDTGGACFGMLLLYLAHRIFRMLKKHRKKRNEHPVTAKM